MRPLGTGLTMLGEWGHAAITQTPMQQAMAATEVFWAQTVTQHFLVLTGGAGGPPSVTKIPCSAPQSSLTMFTLDSSSQ